MNGLGWFAILLLSVSSCLIGLGLRHLVNTIQLQQEIITELQKDVVNIWKQLKKIGDILELHQEQLEADAAMREKRPNPKDMH